MELRWIGTAEDFRFARHMLNFLHYWCSAPERMPSGAVIPRDIGTLELVDAIILAMEDMDDFEWHDEKCRHPKIVELSRAYVRKVYSVDPRLQKILDIGNSKSYVRRVFEPERIFIDSEVKVKLHEAISELIDTYHKARDAWEAQFEGQPEDSKDKYLIAGFQDYVLLCRKSRDEDRYDLQSGYYTWYQSLLREVSESSGCNISPVGLWHYEFVKLSNRCGFFKAMPGRGCLRDEEGNLYRYARYGDCEGNERPPFPQLKPLNVAIEVIDRLSTTDDWSVWCRTLSLFDDEDE